MRAFFFRRSWRERLLLLLVLLVAVAIWGDSVLGRINTLRGAHRTASTDLGNQALLLANGPEVARRLEERLAAVRGGQALNASQLVSRLDGLLRRHKLDFRIDPPASQNKPPVIEHSVTLVLQKAPERTFYDFVDDVAANLPLVNIDQVAITPDRRNPGQLDIRLKLSSLELAH